MNTHQAIGTATVTGTAITSKYLKKYDSFSHILTIKGDDTLTSTFNSITKIDLLNNYIPWVPTNIPQMTIQQYNNWVSDTSKNCATYNLQCHSQKYKSKKIKIITELITFILSLPNEIQHEYHFSCIQPQHIIMFMERSYIPRHGKNDPNIDPNDKNLTVIEKYIISSSSIRTAIGAMSSFLSTNYGRDDYWSIGNMNGNPCKSRRIKDFYSSIVKVNDKRGIKVITATPMKADILITIIDALDLYNASLKRKLNSKKDTKHTLAEILEILLIERDICLYIYLFISLQRGGDATKLNADNMMFGSSKQNDEIDFVDVTIYPHQMKKQTFENKNKIEFTINKNHNWHLKDGPHKDGMPDNYCFIHRYLQFQKLCQQHGYDRNTMISIFPKSKNKKLDFSKNIDYQSAAKKFVSNLKKIRKFTKNNISILNLTLHSFRRGGIQHRHLNGESQESIMKQAGHATKGMNIHYNDNRHIRSQNQSKGGKRSIEVNDEDEGDDEGDDTGVVDINDSDNDDYDEYDQLNDDDDDDDDETYCQICKKTYDEDNMIECSECYNLFHKKCMKLQKTPIGHWLCNECKNSTF